MRGIVHDTAFLHDMLGELQGLTHATATEITDKGLDSLLVVTAELTLVELQGFLLDLLGGVGHITLNRLLDTEDITFRATLDEDFLEGTAAVLVVKTVDGEELLTVIVGKGKGLTDLVELVLELALVKEHEDIGIADDGLLDDIGGDDILDLLRDNTDHSPVLTGGLIEILDIVGHDRGGDGLPRLFNDKTLATVALDTHLLGEDIHDDQHDDGEEDRVILDLVDLEDNELLVEETGVHIIVQRVFKLATFIEGGEDGSEIVNGETDITLAGDLGNTLKGILVVGVERELGDTHTETLLLHLVDILLDLHQETALDKLGGETLELALGTLTLTIGSGGIGDLVTDLLGKTSITLVITTGSTMKVGIIEMVDTNTVLLLQLVLELVILTGLLGVKEELVVEILTLGRGVALKGGEILTVELDDGLVDDGFLNLRDRIGTLEDKEDKGLQEVLLLTEILTVLGLGDLEGVHGDGMLLAVGDIDTAEIAVETFVAVTGIDNDKVGILLVELTTDGVHKETLATAGGTEGEEIGIGGVGLLAFLTGDVNGKGDALTVGIVAFQRGVVTRGLTLLVEKTDGSIGEGEETVVLSREGIAVAGESTDEELQLVVATLGDMDALTAEDILKMVGDLIGVGNGRHGDNQREMGVDEELVLTLNDGLDTLDVLNGNLVGGVLHTGMTVLLGVKGLLLPALRRDIDDLVVNDTGSLGDTVKTAHQVDRHRGVVDTHVIIGTEGVGKTDIVNVKETVDLGLLVTLKDLLGIDLEAGHTDTAGKEILGEETVGIVLDLGRGEETDTLDIGGTEDIIDLLNLQKEITVLGWVIGHQGRLFLLLGDDKIGVTSDIAATVEMTEIAVAEETEGLVLGSTELVTHIKTATDEDILLLDTVTVTKTVKDIVKKSRIGVVAVGVGRELTDKISEGEDCREVSMTGVDDTHTLDILNAVVDMTEDMGTLRAGAESEDADGHTHKDGEEYNQDDNDVHDTKRD